jgi:hypothetical protein
MVELELVESISPETVRQTLKRTVGLSGKSSTGDPSRRRRRVCRPHGKGAGNLRKSLDPECPVACMDEPPVQLIGETRVRFP